ncbi:MAG: hypothetical protein KKC84_00840 [Candidatus Omnitrophica bacterium]|nr:hypothetical protein [Candidatus Omnitrophota bacterium]
MAQKIKIRLPDGREVEATPVEITQASEHWNQYLLEDGSILKIKLVATKISRLDNEFDLEGNPVYSLQSTNVLAVDAPANLKRKNG